MYPQVCEAESDYYQEVQCKLLGHQQLLTQYLSADECCLSRPPENLCQDQRCCWCGLRPTGVEKNLRIAASQIAPLTFTLLPLPFTPPPLLFTPLPLLLTVLPFGVRFFRYRVRLFRYCQRLFRHRPRLFRYHSRFFRS